MTSLGRNEIGVCERHGRKERPKDVYVVNGMDRGTKTEMVSGQVKNDW